MNIELRGFVLEKALVLEDEVNKLVLLYLGIEKEDRKAIGHKSGTLTYKNLLDLLYDIDVLDKTEYTTLLLLMEIRNQFMHNIACDTFEKVMNHLSNDKAKRLLKYDKIGSDTLEQRYNDSFLCLSLEAIRIIVRKIELKRVDINYKAGYIQRLLDFISEYDEMLHEKLDAIIGNISVTDEDLINKEEWRANRVKLLLNVDVLGLKQEFVDKFGEFTTEIHGKSDEMAKRLLK